MIPSIGNEMKRLILSGAKTPKLLGKSSPNRITLATVTKANRKDQAGLILGPESELDNTFAQAKKVMLIARLQRRMQVNKCDALVSNRSIARSVRFVESSLRRCDVVNENNAASLAEKSAESKSIPINAAGTSIHASGLQGLLTDSNGNFALLSEALDGDHSSSAVRDLPKAKSNSLNAGTIIAAVAKAYESDTTLNTASS